MAGSVRRAVQQQGTQLQGFYWFPPTRPARAFHVRHISQLMQTPTSGRRTSLVDTLALVRRLESQGMAVNQAEAITAVITEVLNDSLENAAKSCISKDEMQRREMLQEAAFSRFWSEMQSTQEERYNALQREGEKLRTDMDKLKSEIKHEIEKVTAAQRLDLNLERGYIADKLAEQSSETSNLTNKLDKEINALKTQLQAAKYDVIKYCIGTIVSITAVGLGLIRILM